MSKRRRYCEVCACKATKVLVTTNRTQIYCNREEGKLLEVLRKLHHVLLICLHLYFLLSTFNYTPSGFIFVQFMIWGFIFLTTNPL